MGLRAAAGRAMERIYAGCHMQTSEEAHIRNSETPNLGNLLNRAV